MKIEKRILIIRPDRIGDVVLSTPLPREIKKQFPDSYIAVLVRKYTSDIFINNPNVDKVILIDDIPNKGIKNFWHKVKEIRKYKFTHALSLLPTERTNYLMFFSGIPFRVGVGHKFYQFITWTRFVNRNKYIPLRHETDYCMDLARKTGVNTVNLETEIFLTEDEKDVSAENRGKLLNGRKYLIGIHTTSGNSSPNWPPGTYRKLIEELKSFDDVAVIVTDNVIPDEINNINNIKYPNVKLSLRDTIVNISALDCLISASTGPMHIAAALKVKTISLFCPMTACSPKLWGPMGNENQIILPSENYCSNLCPGNPKKCNFLGEGGIDVEKVIGVVKNELDKL